MWLELDSQRARIERQKQSKESYLGHCSGHCTKKVCSYQSQHLKVIHTLMALKENQEGKVREGNRGKQHFPARYQKSV